MLVKSIINRKRVVKIAPLHLTFHFFPEYSGTSTRLYNILRKLPYPVELISSNKMMDDSIIQQQYDSYGNTHVHRLPLFSKKSLSNPYTRRLSTIYLYYGMGKILKRATDGYKIDVIHAHNMLPFGNGAYQLSAATKRPFVFEIHGVSEDSNTWVGKAAQDAYFKRETHKLASRADRVITLTRAHKAWASKFYGIPTDKITVLPNGVDRDKFSPQNVSKGAVNELKARLGISGKVIMYAGAMDWINGLSGLYEVIPDILRKKGDINFIFVGRGPEENKIIELSKKYPQVKYYSMVPYDQMPIYYQMCDIFVIPRPSTLSSETITPLKLLESMAMGKVVLGSNVGGIGEIIKHGINGFLYEKDNIRDLRDKLFELVDGNNDNVMVRARNTVASNYSWELSSWILNDLYEEIAG